MGITRAYTLTEARARLADYKECEIALVHGQAKEYRVGSRWFTALDLKDIVKRIEQLANLVDALEKNRSGTRVRRVVPRDM